MKVVKGFDFAKNGFAFTIGKTNFVYFGGLKKILNQTEFQFFVLAIVF